jgi:hypothetical protein
MVSFLISFLQVTYTRQSSSPHSRYRYYIDVNNNSNEAHCQVYCLCSSVSIFTVCVNTKEQYKATLAVLLHLTIYRFTLHRSDLVHSRKRCNLRWASRVECNTGQERLVSWISSPAHFPTFNSQQLINIFPSL